MDSGYEDTFQFRQIREDNLIAAERARCIAIVQAAREGEGDSDLRSIMYEIRNPKDTE